MKVQIYRAADAKRHADKVAAAAMRAGIPRIVADNGNAYVDIEPCP
jgi:pyrimidine deaminase RibD-like protein